MKLSDYVLDFVARQNVKHCFTLSGGGCMHLIDSLGREKRIEYVCNLHEQGSAIAAEAYAQFTNNLGFCLVTTGPGGTNTVTGVAGAWLESTPVLFISGQVKRADLKSNAPGVRQLGPQEIDMVSIVKPITKYAATVMDPKDIRYHLEKAVYLAKNGRRGPVWLEMPLDIQASQIDETTLRGFDPEAELKSDLISKTELKSKVTEIVNLLNKAERPVIFAGNGVRASGAMAQFQQVIDKLQIPVLLSWKAIDFIDDTHPLHIGRPGGVGQRAANFTQQNSDFILVLGTRLDLSQLAFNQKLFAREATRVMVDIDSSEINKFQGFMHHGIACDAGVFLNELLEQTPQIQKKWPTWLEKTQSWRKKYPYLTPDRWKTEGFVSTYAMVDALSECVSDKAVLVPGSSGPCSEVFFQAFRYKKGQRIVNTQGLGSMGFGLPASIGVCLASGRQPTICMNGDGGFQLNIQELETIRRLQLPIHFFILCNGGYASIMTSQRNFFDGRFYASEPSSGVTLPDIKKIAQVYDFPVFKIADHKSIHQQIKEVLSHKGPTITEVIVSPEDYTAPRAKSVIRPDGTMATLPMEDLWPFLPRDEFMSNMLIKPMQESKELKPD